MKYHADRLTNLLLHSITVFSATAVMAHPGHGDEVSDAVAAETYLVQAGTPKAGEKSALKNEVKISIEGEFRIIKSNGWPDHAPGEFPRRGNPNVPTAQAYSFKVPVKPTVAETPARRGGWWWGVALNGVPFEPGTGETWNNDPQSGWRYEAATGFLNLGLDEHNAHVQPNGSYHYHALPVGLVEKLGGDTKSMRQLGWAADGYPLYTSMAYSKADDAKSELRKMKPSYRLKAGERPTEPNGPTGKYDGRFTQDFEFVKDLGDLDECNGRTGVTPEFPLGTYYYCISAEFPFVPRMWHGTPDSSFSKGDRPPGGGPGGGGGQRPAQLGGPPRGILEGGPPSGPPVPGGSPGGFVPPIVGAMDLNKDGVLDKDEIAKATESLKSLDKNGDGKLTQEEFRPAPGSGPPGGAGAPPR
jgi:hypothetical protein